MSQGATLLYWTLYFIGAITMAISLARFNVSGGTFWRSLGWFIYFCILGFFAAAYFYLAAQ